MPRCRVAYFALSFGLGVLVAEPLLLKGGLLLGFVVGLRACRLVSRTIQEDRRRR
jgi:hypothetical protein